MIFIDLLLACVLLFYTFLHMQKTLGSKFVSVKRLQFSTINFLNLDVTVEAIKLEIWLWIYLASDLKMFCFESEDFQILFNFVMNISAAHTDFFLLS